MIMVVSSYDSMSMLQPKTKTKPPPSSSLSSSFVNQNPFNPLPDSFRSETSNSSSPSLLFSSIAHRPRTGIAALADHPESNSKCNNNVDDNNKSCHHSRKTSRKQLIPLAAVSSATRPTLLSMNNNNDNINNNESLLLVNRIEICRTNQALPPTSHTATTFEQTDDNQMVKLIKSVTNNSGTSGLTQTSPTMNCMKLQQQPPNANMSTTISNNKSTRNDTLLDRKAFISLEKSINWQSILVNTNIVDDVVDSASTFNCGDGNTNSRITENSFPTKTTSETMEFSFPGMKHVPSWLKLLRLHKYAPIFAHMSYEEMMNLTEHDLERRNITKGARQKLYLSIQKLKARSAVLLASEQQLLHWNSKNYRKNITYSELSQVLFQIRAFLSTPIRATTTKDYPTMDHPSTTRTMLDPTYLVDVNNNNSNHVSNNLVSPSPRDKFQTIIICWSMLTNNDLPSIIVRLLGHVVNIWTLKCRRHLQQLNLWQDYFREFYDKSSILDILFELNCETNKRRRTKMNEFDSDADEDDGHDEDDGDDDHEKADDYFSKQTSGHESDKENQDDGFIVVGHNRSVLNNNSRSSGRPTTSTDVDGGSLENGDDDTKSDGPCPMVKLNIDREELYNMLKRIIDECLLHEAFRPHQTLLLHLLEQLKYLFFALKIIINVDSNQTMHEPQTFTASSNPTNIGNHSDMLNNPMLLDGHKTNHHLFQQPNQPKQQQQQQPQSSDPDNLQCNQCPCVTSNIITTGNQPNHHQRHQQNQYCCHHSNNNNEFGGSIVALRLSSTSNQRQSNISGVSSSNASNMMVSSDNYHHHHHNHHHLQQQHSFSLKQKMNNGGQHQSSLTSIANNNNNNNNNNHHANGRRLSTNNCTNKNLATDKSGKSLQYPQQNNHHNHYHQNNHHRSYRHNNGNNRTKTNSSIMVAQQKTYQDNHHNISGNRLSSFGDSLENNTHSDNNHHHYTKRNQNNHNIVGQNGLYHNNLQQNGSNQATGIQSNGLNVKSPNLLAINQHEPSFNDSKSSYKRSTPEMNLQNLLLQQLITVKNQYNHQQNNDHNYTNDWLNRGSSSSFNNLYSTTSSPLSSSSSSSTSNYCSKSPCDNEALDFENIGSPLFDGLHSNVSYNVSVYGIGEDTLINQLLVGNSNYFPPHFKWFDFDQTNSLSKWTNDNEETSPSLFDSNDLQLLECIDWNFIEKSETFENFSKELDHHHYSSVHYDCFDDNRKLQSCFNYAGLRGSIDNLSEIPVTTTTRTTTTTTAAQTASSSATAAMTSVTFDDIEQLSIRIAEHALEING